MEKVLVYDIPFERLLAETAHSGVFSKPIGSALKLLCPDYLELLNSNGFSLENKILNSSKLDLFPEIVVPNSIVYDNFDNFMGYLMPIITADTYNAYNSNKTALSSEIACDLSIYAREFSKIEGIVKRSDDVVFADLLDPNNIMLNEKNYYFVDYDGLQVNGFLSDSFVEFYDKYKGTKYVDGKFFTKQYDIRNLIYLYFDSVFNYDLSRIDGVSEADRSSFIDCELSGFGLDFDEIKDKVYKLYQDGANCYLGDTVHSIADRYDMCLDGNGKRFVKKKI